MICYGTVRTHPVVRTCEACQAVFSVRASDAKRGQGRFCSRDCYRQGAALPLIDRFFRYVGSKTPTGCILWTGCTNKRGYGVIGSGPPRHKMIVASRISYELFVGPIPETLFVLHRCDNPPCINPVHLLVGTHADNLADMAAKGRSMRGELQHNAVLTSGDVREIRRRAAAGEYMKHLANEYHVNPQTVADAVHRKTWRHID